MRDWLHSENVSGEATADGDTVLLRAKDRRLDPQIREAVRATARQ